MFYAAQCSSSDANSSVVDNSVFGRVWQQNLSVPLFLIVVLFPLINFKSPTFFTKLNALGTFTTHFWQICLCVDAVLAHHSKDIRLGSGSGLAVKVRVRVRVRVLWLKTIHQFITF